MAHHEWARNRNSLHEMFRGAQMVLIALVTRLALVSDISPEAPALHTQIHAWRVHLRGYQLWLESLN